MLINEKKLRCPCNRRKRRNKSYLDENKVKITWVDMDLCWNTIVGFLTFFHREHYIRPFSIIWIWMFRFHLSVLNEPQINAKSGVIFFKNIVEEMLTTIITLKMILMKKTFQQIMFMEVQRVRKTKNDQINWEEILGWKQYLWHKTKLNSQYHSKQIKWKQENK